MIVKQSSVLHSMCEIAIIPFLNQKEICFTHNKENSVHNIVCALRFQQLLANKHHRLRDAKFEPGGGGEAHFSEAKFKPLKYLFQFYLVSFAACIS